MNGKNDVSENKRLANGCFACGWRVRNSNTFNMQRNEKPARPHPFQSKYVLYSQEERLIVSYSKS